MTYKKKLIEVALPLEDINNASVREKSIRHGHPSTLHLWWSRKPTATARAVIWSSLVDDPSAHPEQFPSEETQNAERERLFNILRELVIWENSNNKQVLDAAKAEIMKSTDGNPPPLLDPFAGGGSIPLEAQRLGLKAYASDLNPVAVLINKAMIEIPPKFANQPPVNPEAKNQIRTWDGAQGLAEDVRYYGKWMKEKSFEKIGHLYPKVKDEQGKEHTVIAWFWTRTVKCPNPACGCEMPLANSFELSKKRGKETYVRPKITDKKILYVVEQGKDSPEPPKTSRGPNFKCICCGEATTPEYIKSQGIDDKLGVKLMALVAEDKSGRIYVSSNPEQIRAANVEKPGNYPSQRLAYDPRNLWSPSYGLNTFDKLFTNRQLLALTTFSDLIKEVRQKMIQQNASTEYAEAISVYLAFTIDKMADINSSLCSWIKTNEVIRNTFARQAIPMSWDFVESNPFSNSSGSFDLILEKIVQCIEILPSGEEGLASQQDAQTDNGYRNVMISTDPPYYDNIAYGNLSDFFYVWLRNSIKDLFPSIFKTALTPKAEELIASPYRFDGGIDEARVFFEDGMLQSFKALKIYANQSIPVTVYYAYKQSETEGDSNASTGWEAILSAIVQSGFSIVGTWPLRTERIGRMNEIEVNALASSIVLVCRKREENAPVSTRRDFINTLKRELKPALKELQKANIAPVDLAQSAIGPGMAVYSRYSQVLEADGTPMSVRSALQIINQELDLFLTEQDGELDPESRFCVDLYKQFAFNEMKFGEADVLARAKNTSVDALANRGVLQAQKGVVRLLTREELPLKPNKEILWLLTQQLTRAMESDGVSGAARIVANIVTSEPERAKALAYRLYTIAERKKWAAEAFAYNSLVSAWSDVQHAAAQLRTSMSSGQQTGLFD